MAGIDLVDWPDDQPLRISGAPAALRAPLALRDDPAAAPPQAALIDVRSASGEMVATRSVGLARGQMRVRLDPTTPPGRYAGAVEIAGVTRPVEIDVVEAIDLAVRPSSVMIDLARGRAQKIGVAFENRGNGPLTIDLTGDYPLGEELPIFPERTEPETGGGLQRLADLFARTIGVRARRAMREAGRVTLAMPDGAISLAPGAAGVATVSVTVSEGLSSVVRYRAFIPIYAADLELVAVTATKQAPPKERRPARSQGAST